MVRSPQSANVTFHILVLFPTGKEQSPKPGKEVCPTTRRCRPTTSQTPWSSDASTSRRPVRTLDTTDSGKKTSLSYQGRGHPCASRRCDSVATRAVRGGAGVRACDANEGRELTSSDYSLVRTLGMRDRVTPSIASLVPNGFVESQS